MAVRIGIVILYRLNAQRPAKKVERRQASKTCAPRPAEIGFEEAIDLVAGGKSSNRSRRCVQFPCEAMRSRCVFGKPKPPRATARRDRFAGRWFGGGRRTRSSSGTRPAYQHSC